MGFLSTDAVTASNAPAESGGGRFIHAKEVIPAGVPTAEQEALQSPTFADPIGTMAKHPYITAGVLGAALGPEALAAVPGAGTALGGAALGAGEQMAYQKIAEEGQKLAGPEHPYLGLIPGLIAPSLVGGATHYLSSVPKASVTAARDAAEAAEQSVYEKAPKQLYDYGQKVQAATEKETGAIKTLGEKGASAVEKVQKQATEAMAPELAQRELEKFTGRTPEDTAAARTADPQEFAARRARMRQVVMGPASRVGDELGQEFQAATEGKLGNEAQIGHVEKAVASEQKWLTDHNSELAKPVRDLIAEMPVGEVDSALEAQVPELLRGKGPKEAQARFTGILKEWDTKNPGAKMESDDLKGMAVRAMGGKTNAKPTVGQLLGWRTAATKLVGATADHNQVVALELRDALDKSLMDSGVEISPALRERWGGYKATFNSKFRHQVATAADPVQYGKALFEQPQRGLQVWKAATPDEQGHLRQLFGDYVNANKLKPLQLGKRVDPAVMKQMFGDSPYAQIKPWLETEPKAVAWQHFRQTDPQAEALVKQGAQRELENITTEKAGALRKAGIELAEKMGVAGRGKLGRILAQKDPVAAAKIVEQEFPFSPEQAQQLYRQAQAQPARQSLTSFREGKQLEKGLDINRAREDAAVGALMKGGSNVLLNSLKRRLFAWHLPMLMGGALMGHVAGYQTGISGMIVGMMGAESLRKLLQPSLATPEAATAYWRSIALAPNSSMR